MQLLEILSKNCNQINVLKLEEKKKKGVIIKTNHFILPKSSNGDSPIVILIYTKNLA